jgi:CubicO group peptidase (beta-lactamase class C family)
LSTGQASGDGGASSSGGADAGLEASAQDATDAADASLDDPPIPARYQAFATAFDDERRQLGASGAAVALIENGQITFFHGFGTKGPNSTSRVRARTLFRIGSMTKALTATAFMSLVQDGKLDPTALVTSAIPDLALDPTYLKSLTLHEVLSQQTGLFDYLVLDGDRSDASLSQMLTSSIWRTTDYFMAPPATFWDYSNPNYYIAGLAVERAAGVSYRQAVAQRVLAPLGMTRTVFLPSDVTADGDFSNGKSTNTDGTPWDVAPDTYDNAWGRPAGYAFSSVLDYARFVQFLHAGNPAVLADAQRQEMVKSQVSTLDVGPFESYGYAIFVNSGFAMGKDWYPTAILEHGGDIPGFASDFYLVPSTGFGIVSFANADGAHFAASLVLALQSFAGLPSPTSLPSQLTVDPSTFPPLAGTYYESHQVVGHVVISVSNTGVVGISMPDLDAVTPPIPYDKTLTPVTPGDFVFNLQGTPEELTFVPDATGTPTWLRSRDFACQRQPAGAAGGMPSPQDRIVIDPAVLRARLHSPRL